MIDGAGPMALTVLLFAFSGALTAAALWLAGRLAPWFLKERFEPPTVRSFFFDFVTEAEPTYARTTTMLLAVAIMLAVMTPLIALIRFGGIVG